MHINILEKNIALLKKHHPEQYKKIINYKKPNSRYEVLDTRSGEKTIKVNFSEENQKKTIYLHSKFNPIKEGEMFAQENMKDQKDINILYGFGMGYHVQFMSNFLNDQSKLIIFDLNLDIFVDSLQYRDFSDVLIKDNVKLFISDRLEDISDHFVELLHTYTNINFVMHVPSITSINGDEDFKFLLQDLNLRKSISSHYVDLLKVNYLTNLGNIKRNVGEFFNKFISIPIIIVCAGPSLDKNKHLLKGLENKALIICVGEALKTMVAIGIYPHIIITIDPNEITYKQIESLENLDIPFILLATAAAINSEKYKGPKFIACQSEKYLSEDKAEYLVETGGSVSTTALDIAIRMGGNPVIFVGQDLAYTDNKHHCLGSSHENVETKHLKNMRIVKNYLGEELPTTLGMLSFKRWIQKRVSREQQITFINATEGGAFIEGFKHMSFEEVIYNYLNINYEISRAVKDVLCH